MKKTWTQQADEEVCKSVLDGSFNDKIADVLAKKHHHSKAAIKKRAQNYKHFTSGGKKGLTHYSKQTKETYDKLSKLY